MEVDAKAEAKAEPGKAVVSGRRGCGTPASRPFRSALGCALGPRDGAFEAGESPQSIHERRRA